MTARRAAATAIGGKPNRACLHTTLAWTLGVDDDPVTRTKCKQVTRYLTALQDDSNLRRLVFRHWDEIIWPLREATSLQCVIKMEHSNCNCSILQ